MTSILTLVLELLLGVLLTAWVVRFDRRRLPPERFLRSWNDASFWSAVVAFGPLSIPVHFARTRRSVLGFVIGCAWMIGVLAVLELLASAVMWIAGEG